MLIFKMKKMKNIFLLLGTLLFVTACSTDLDQSPPNLASADSLTDFEGVLNAAYYYQLEHKKQLEYQN